MSRVYPYLQPAGGKRKRSSAAQTLAVYRPYKSPYKRRKPAFIPGVDRTGGYYGRFAGRGAELKFLDVTLDDAVIATGGVITDTINVIAQNTSETGRIGRKCTIKSINWNGFLSIPEDTSLATPNSGDRIRLILYLDKQANGAAATQAGILETTAFDSYRNLANSGRFQILMDKKFVLNYLTLSGSAANVHHHTEVLKQFSFYKSCNIPIEYSGTDGLLAEMRSNNLGILIMDANGIGAIGSRIRLRFSDA